MMAAKENREDGTDRRRGSCAHGFRSCSFCAWPPRAPRRHKLRCAACGRFRKPDPTDLCPRCIERGFVALRLFAP